MIKNEREYRITKAQARHFEQAVEEFATRVFDNVQPELVEAERRALESQLKDLRRDLSEYEAAKRGEIPIVTFSTLSQLPKTLILARIARGWSQRDLAERLNIKEQQIQRYEATDYESASFSRLLEIAEALDVSISGETATAASRIDVKGFFRRMLDAGINKDLISKRLLPPGTELKEDSLSTRTVLELFQTVSRVFGWGVDALAGISQSNSAPVAFGTIRFKVRAGANVYRLSAYTAYAEYLARIVVACTDAADSRLVAGAPNEPISARILREGIVREFGDVNLQSLLAFSWRNGIRVLPLQDSGAFHGACMRFSGQTVVILKQVTPSSARWSLDLLHELYHAWTERGEDFEIIEDHPLEETRRLDGTEIEATRFAFDVLLNGCAEEMAEACVEQARGKVQLLRSVVPKVATEYKVDQGALAHYLALRLSNQGIDWWGAATNLQTQEDRLPFDRARSELLSRIDLAKASEPDRTLLLRALF